MRRNTVNSRRLPRVAAACAAAGLMLAAIAPASAGGFVRERVYDDSFGNLIVLSPSGYKRIVVGMGHVAAELEQQQGPRVVYGENGHSHYRAERHCYRPGVLWHGRSYMYGLSDGELPTPPLICE